MRMGELPSVAARHGREEDLTVRRLGRRRPSSRPRRALDGVIEKEGPESLALEVVTDGDLLHVPVLVCLTDVPLENAAVGMRSAELLWSSWDVEARRGFEDEYRRPGDVRS